jgi:hypothetical protein
LYFHAHDRGPHNGNHACSHNTSRYNARADDGRSYNSDNTRANDRRPDHTDDSCTHDCGANYRFNVRFISKHKI